MRREFKQMSAIASIFALIVLCITSCNKQESKYTFSWGTKLLSENDISIDSIQILDEDGAVLESFKDFKSDSIHFEGNVDKPMLATLNVFLKMYGQSDSQGISFILEPGDIVFDSEIGTIKGTPLNDKRLTFEAKLFECQNEDATKSCIKQFLEENKSNLAGVSVLCSGILENFIAPEEIIKLWEGFSDESKAYKCMKELKERLDGAMESTAGKKFIDFECEYNGQVQKLSDYVGKGKYVLVDFWASWCGPCRGEIPNLKAVYNKYASDKFEVLGVATWDEPEETLKAIKEEGVTYPQIINAQKAGSDAYSINGIPEIILFGPDGTIIKRGLRGEDIEKAVSEALAE